MGLREGTDEWSGEEWELRGDTEQRDRDIVELKEGTEEGP